MSPNIAEKCSFRITHINVNGIRHKLDSLQNFLVKHRIDIACISESKIQPNFPDGLLEIDGYNFLRLDRLNSGGGGLMVCFLKI